MVPIHVACGVLLNAQGQVLLAQRPEGKIAQGYWEFPGGKIEAEESAFDALRRELLEEIGIYVVRARRFLDFVHHYSNRSIALDTWLVTEFTGEPQGRENQALRWCQRSELQNLEPLLPTVLPILAALRLPEHYVITPDAVAAERLIAQLPQLPPSGFLRLRAPSLTLADYADWAAAIIPPAQALGLQVIVDRTPELAIALRADGWHANSHQLQALRTRPAIGWVIGSAHHRQQLLHAQALGLDAALLSPVAATQSHADATPLGWSQFAALRQGLTLPVYALGGMHTTHLPDAWVHGGQGIAGISAYWSSSD